MTKWIYMYTPTQARASASTLSYETQPVDDEWDFVRVTVNNGRTYMVFRKEAND